MDDSPRRRLERKSGSSSRSPSLSRRPSLKDKKAPGTIAKVKGKKSGGSGSKKERWLLTRKTWRYMSDAVGNLLPETHKSTTSGGGATSSGAAGTSFSATTGHTSSGSGGSTRRTSSSGVGGAYCEPGPSSSYHPVASTPGFHVADIPGGGYAASSVGGGGGGRMGGASRPMSMPSAIPTTGTGSGQQSKASSTVTSPTYGGIMSFPSHRPGVTPTGPGPGKVLSPTSQSQQQQILISTDKFYPPSDDIPTLEKHFEAVCNKEKRFLLWTRTKPKGLSGPALRDVKLKTQKEPKSGKGSGSKTSSGHRDSSGSILEALHMRFGGGGSSAGAKDSGGDYYSPTTEEDDDYDEYDDQDEITVRERRKSSTASSTSMLGTGQCWTQGSLTFFRPLSTLSSHGSESSYSMILTPQGITKICRNTGTQTDPFPEELLIRFRLQAVQEERQQQQQQQQQQQCLRQISPDNQSDATTVESPMSPVRLDTTQKICSPPPTTTTASPMSPTTSTDGVRSSGSGRESQEKLLETTAASSTRPSISGQSESMATTKGGEGTSTSTTTTTTSATTDKKSEESGYSSSISDTVMRYLRMVRKNSKADNKDTIDKFKTVNYDRSLRYIKSKNVTVEEALEYDKNKEAQKLQLQAEFAQLAAAQKLAASGGVAPTPVTVTTTQVTTSSGQPESGGTSPGVEAPNTEKTDETAKGSGPVTPEQQQQSSPSSPTTAMPTMGAAGTVLKEPPVDNVPVLSAIPPGSPTKTSGQQSDFDNDIPPSSPPPPPPISPSLMSPKEGRAFSPGSPPPQGPPPLQQAEGPSSVGIQAGESLIRFLKNLNPNPLARKMSDFSSSCCSSESPVELFSPRYSFATTVMSGSDTEMFGGGGGVHQAAMASMMAMAAAKGSRRPMESQTSVGGGIPQTPGGVDLDAPSEFDDVFQGMQASFFQKQHHHHSHQQGQGPLSSSWTSSGATTSTSQQTIKKSSSVQQMMSFGGTDLGAAVPGQPPSQIPITTTSSSSYSLSQLFHYSPSKSFRSRDRDKTGGAGGGGGHSPDTTSTPATPTTSSIGGSSGGLMKTFFGSSPFSSTFGLKKGGLRKPTSTTSLTITTNTGSDSVSGRGMNAPPPTTSSSPNLLSLIQSSAASAGTGFTNLFSSSSRSGSSITSASQSRGGGGGGGGGGSSGGGISTAAAPSSSAASSSGELRAQEAGSSSSLIGSPYLPLYARSSLPISVTSGGGGGGGTRRGLSIGGHHPHHHHHHVSTHASSSSYFMPTSGLSSSDYLYSHDSSSSAGKKPGSASSSTRSNVDLYLTPSGVMQKSKSSSSVLPLYGSSGSVSGARGSSGSAHLRVSPSGSIGGGDGGSGGAGEGAASSSAAAAGGAAAPTSSSGGNRLISKSKLFKSRSKSSTRATTSSSGSAICTWSPQGRCKWKSVSGKVVTLEPTTVLSLSEVERLTLQDVALEKLRALNLGVDVKIPKEKVGGGQQKPKRRPYLLKKKALSTGFFESGSKREDSKESTGGGSGLVFGISLSQCVANDRLRQIKASATAAAQLSTDWEQPQASSTTHKRSQNGSRNSVSSVFEMPKDDKDPLQAVVPTSSTCVSVPAIVTACINHLENYGLHTTGIFRVSTSLKRIRQLREDLDSGKDINFGEDHSPHDVAALLKEFLRDLPEPLLCRDLYQAFLKTQKIRNRKLQLEAIQHLVQLLPVSNRDTLASLLKFFAKVVANSSETRSKTGELLPGNKMEGYSLATLIAPNILPCMPTEGVAVAAAAAASASSMDQNAALTKERRESIDLVNYMISNFSVIFDVTPELLHDVYLHLMDTNPEAIEGILRQRCGVSDDGIDELETTSSVFEESEGGEVVDPEETLTSTSRVYRRREEILHEGAGKGGIGTDESRTRERRLRRDEGGGGAVHSTGGGAGAGGASSDTEKQTQSGGESDSSIGTRSTSRWFRRSRGDAKGRTSSDSGSEKVKGSRKRESSLFESKRASSLDSVNIQEPLTTSGGGTGPSSSSAQQIRVSPRTSAVISGVGGGPGAGSGVHVGGQGDIVSSRPLSGSDQSLRVPEHLMSTRRQSSPVLESSGIITASLKIPVPVPLNIDDTDIPYIEDENNGETGEGTTSVHPYHHHHHHHLVHHHQQSHYQSHPQYQPPQQQQPSTSQQQQKYSQAGQYPYPYHQMQMLMQQPHDLPPSLTDPTNVTMVRCRSMSTDSSVPLKTTSSSLTTTPISSPARQPSSEISSPTGFSPPTSPPLYGTFPIEEMTARMLIGSAAASSSTPSTVTALSSSPSLHQFHHHGAITMTTPSGVVATSSTVHQFPSVTTSMAVKDPLLETKSAGSTPITRPKIDKTTTSSSSGAGALATAAASVSSSSSSTSSSATTSTGRPTVISSSPHLSQKPLTASGQGAIASLASTTTKSATSPQQTPISSSTTSSSSSSTVAPYASSSLQQQPSSSTSTSHAVPPVSTQPTPSTGQSSTSTSSSGMLLTAPEPKGLGRETKGANIGGLIKSKTADFEKLTTTPIKSASMSYVEPPPPPEQVISSSGGGGSAGAASGGTVGGTTPGTISSTPSTEPPASASRSSSSHHHHQIYSIAPKMRLRSQENVLLKQQFLLRQQQQHQQGESSTTRRERAASLKGAEQTTQLTCAAEQFQQQTPSQEETSSHQYTSSGERGGSSIGGGGASSGRSITRRRLVGSASSSAIISSSGGGGGKPSSSSSSSSGGGSSTTLAPPPQQRVRSRESESASSSSSTSTVQQQSSSSTVAPPQASSSSGLGSSPSRWKRSEIIASRQQSQNSPPDPETFV